MPMPLSSSRTRYWLGAFLVFLAAFCFASKGILIKLAYQYPIDSISLLTLRMLFALPFYIALAIRLSRQGPPMRLTIRQWATLFFLGITGYYAASFFNFLGLVYITASLERILLFTYPTFVLLLNAVGFGRQVTRLQLLALALTYAGILLAFVGNIDTTVQKDVMLGAFWVILSGLVYAVYLVGSDRVIARVGSQRFTCYAMMAATVPTVLHCAFENGLQLSGYPASVYILGLSMGIFVTVIPTLMIAEGIKRIGSGNASIIGSVGPVFTLVLSTTILNELISWQQIAGTFLVLAGVFLIGWRGSSQMKLESE
ncbi:DMT family transporter [Spirosoma utsteinense]|uniref:Drug/metabolite transporter (DMT)-like permease n=2 Tax=Spirosoma utsteinense TaxID=2585773 RepID=A0ABR6W0L8_9BACT|nr:DMT family transporter [Spirosoma utsteinense]MBC3790161.1 drug/metabolite transporter (DMT)-like permease [Spirosoma utsteinense]